MSKKFTSRWFCAELDKYSAAVKSGLMSKEVVEKDNQRQVDFDNFATNLESIYEELDQQGYDVVNVVPISTGQSESSTQSDKAFIADVGFSITRGAVVIGKKKNEP